MKRWEIWLSDGVQAVKARILLATEETAMIEAKEVSDLCTYPNVLLMHERKEFGAWHEGNLIRRGRGIVSESNTDGDVKSDNLTGGGR